MREFQLIHASGVPENPLDAAADFYARNVPEVRNALASTGCVIVTFPPAEHSHDAWRLAAIQELAREAAPARVNGVTGEQDPALDHVACWLADQPGVTGQILVMDGKSAEKD